jgi:hypothetical protein
MEAAFPKRAPTSGGGQAFMHTCICIVTPRGPHYYAAASLSVILQIFANVRWEAGERPAHGMACPT